MRQHWSNKPGAELWYREKADRLQARECRLPTSLFLDGRIAGKGMAVTMNHAKASGVHELKRRCCLCREFDLVFDQRAGSIAQ
jgi:hypothetical protein